MHIAYSTLRVQVQVRSACTAMYYEYACTVHYVNNNTLNSYYSYSAHCAHYVLCCILAHYVHTYCVVLSERR